MQGDKRGGGGGGVLLFFCLTRRLGQSPDLFPYLRNCVHNPPLVLEVSWLSYCKEVFKSLPVLIKVGEGPT